MNLASRSSVSPPIHLTRSPRQVRSLLSNDLIIKDRSSLWECYSLLCASSESRLLPCEAAHGKLTLLGTRSHKAYQRVRDGNFLLEGLVGINIKGKTVGIIGTGRIGLCAGKILAHGFGAEVIAHDPYPVKDAASYGITYTKDLDELFARSDIISIHCPLLESTKYIINENSISKMKDGVFLVNTSRGGLIDTSALIKGLKAGKFGAVGLDVYEKEQEYFFKDSSETIILDDQLSRLLTFNNVFMSGHQAYLTYEVSLYSSSLERRVVTIVSKLGA